MWVTYGLILFLSTSFAGCDDEALELLPSS